MKNNSKTKSFFGAELIIKKSNTDITKTKILSLKKSLFKPNKKYKTICPTKGIIV